MLFKLVSITQFWVIPPTCPFRRDGSHILSSWFRYWKYCPHITLHKNHIVAHNPFIERIKSLENLPWGNDHQSHSCHKHTVAILWLYPCKLISQSTLIPLLQFQCGYILVQCTWYQNHNQSHSCHNHSVANILVNDIKMTMMVWPQPHTMAYMG